MIYNILMPIVRFALKLYFRKIHIVGLENLPKDKPIICVCNHPSSFIEPCLMACFLPVEFHFLVRGDVFSKKWLNWLLVGTNQIPVFRRRDGVANVKKNVAMRERLKHLFKENNALLMFAEGSMEEHIYLRKLQKGVAHFAFMEPNEHLQVVPLGVNYLWSTPFNSPVTIKVSKPIPVSKFKDENYATPAEKIKNFMDEVREGMQNSVRHIENTEMEPLIYDTIRIVEFRYQDSIFPVVDYSKESYSRQNVIAKSLDSGVGIEKAKNIVENYEDALIKQPSVINWIGMLLFAPFYVIGRILHFIPIKLGERVGFSLKAHEFHISVSLAVIFVTNIALFFLFLILAIFMGWEWFLGILLYFILGFIAAYYAKAYHQYWEYLFAKRDRKVKSDELFNMNFSF